MDKKIEIYITKFGKRYFSNNVEYKLLKNVNNSIFSYVVYKKGTNILHNEYGPAYENEYEDCGYFINNKSHKLIDCSYYNSRSKIKEYHVIEKFLGNSKEEFIKNLANVLVPKENNE